MLHIPTRSLQKNSITSCERGRHSAISATRVEIDGLIHAECRHCGCRLTRMAASRRWFRTGLMGG